MLWIVGESKKVPDKVREILSVKENEIYYSTISIWEVAIKRLTHPDKITALTPKELVGFCKEAGLLELPLALEHVYTLETISRQDNAPPHKDPFDRTLISQAKSESMTFITHDDKLTTYTEPCILYV
ncbi:MAG: type II toxin-antitoxin system VapC family toxin [Synergistaceae bacterium]|nr:type II toxin-antitoxin system VapC family toxin [Synergistaceae bacterium]